MNIFVDVDLHQLIQAPGAKQPANPWELKSQDTVATNLFFCSDGNVVDMGESPVLKFGLVAKSDITTFLVFESTFVRLVDPVNGICYQALAVFNTTQMVAALGVLSPLPCILEIRFQLADGEIVHTLDQLVTIDRTILVEGGTPATTVIAVYPDPTVLELKSNRDQKPGTASLDVNGFLKPTDFDPTVVVLQSTRDAALGHPGLDSQSLLSALQIPADGSTIVVTPSIITRTGTTTSGSPIVTGLSATSDLTLLEPVTGTGIPGGATLLSIDSPSQITLSANATASGSVTITFTTQKLSAVGPTQGVIAITQSNFTVPAVGANQTINVPTTNLVPGLYYNISGGAGAYQYISPVDATHGTFQNVGGAANAAPGTNIAFPVNIIWSGPPGPSSGGGIVGIVTTAFTVPTPGNDQSINVDDAVGFPYQALITIKVPGSSTTYGVFYIDSLGGTTSFSIQNNVAVGSTNAGGDTIPVGARIVLVDFHPRNPPDRTIEGFRESPSAKNYTVILNAVAGTEIRSFAIQLLSGTCAASLNINGTPLLASIAVTSTRNNITGIFQTLSAGDFVELVLSSLSSAVDLSYSLALFCPPLF